LVDKPSGKGTIESYTIIYGKDGQPTIGVVIGRRPDNARFIAMTNDGDTATLAAMATTDPLGATIDVVAGEKNNRFVLT
jgi:hypothetical protein